MATWMTTSSRSAGSPASAGSRSGRSATTTSWTSSGRPRSIASPAIGDTAGSSWRRPGRSPGCATSRCPAEGRRRVAEHRARIEARINRLQRVLHVLGQLSAGKEPLVSETTTATAPELDAAAHRRLGVDLFNHTWTLIEKPDRTAAETDEMIHAAHASRYHWSKAGTTVNLGRGEWQIARVYSVLRRAEPAVWHAGRCLAYVEAAIAAGEAEDWDLAAAREAMARAAAVAGDEAEAIRWRDLAREALAAIEDPADRELIEGDLATLPL
jgi:hypothetical protein